MKKMMKCYLALALGFVIAGCSKDSKDSKESSRESSEHSIVDSGHKGVQLWKDGPYWAETNVGAQKPWESGYFFWWGDTVGYKRVDDNWAASDGSTSRFSFSARSVPTHGKNLSTLHEEGWITADCVLAPECDAANVHWGGKWRMPTNQELKDLCDKCDWEGKTLNGVDGCVVRGRGDYASASIFLPCVGYAGGMIYDANSRGVCWSSVPDSDKTDAWNLVFHSGYHNTLCHGRYHGRSVRPVQGPAKKREQEVERPEKK